MSIAETNHIINILPPIDINGAGATSDYFTMKGADSVDIILTLGVTGAASTVTIEESTTNAGASTTAIGFRYKAETTAAGDTLDSAWTTATASGFATSTNDSVTYVINIKAAELSAGYPYLVLKMSDPSAATLVSAIAIQNGVRYQQAVTPTAIV